MHEFRITNHDDWALFEEHERPNRVRNYQICCLVAAFFMPAGFILDLIDFGLEGMWTFLPARLLSSAALLLCWAALKLPTGVKSVEVMGLIVAVPPIAAIAWMISETGGATSPYYAGLNLVTLGAGLLMRWRTRDSVIVSIVTILAFILASASSGIVENWSAVGNNIYFLVVNGFIVVVGTWVYVGIRFREFQANRQLALSQEELEVANLQLGQQNEQLKELDEAKSNFFANISHELRTPLTLLQAPIQRLLTHGDQMSFDQQKQQLLRMQVNTTRLLGLINDLLDLAKVEAGRLDVRWRPTNVRKMVSELELSLRGAAEEKGLTLTSSIEEGISGAEFDTEKMERVCINLLSNALKFTPEGGEIDFRVDVRNGELRFQVRDTGIGLSADHMRHLFDRFWQADNSSIRRYQGTGIGLSLVKEFSEAHGGRVIPESAEGKGTTFTVSIPYRPCKLTGARLSRGETGGALASVDWSRFIRTASPELRKPTADLVSEEASEVSMRPKVIIAEDEPDVREFIVSELEPHFSVRAFNDGASAVSAAKDEPPDVILTDMMMPIMDGLQVCRELRAVESTVSVPIVVLTARTDDETRIGCLDAGATDFLTKPFSPMELMVKLRNLAELSSRRKEIQFEKIRLEKTLTQLQATEAMLMRNEKLASLGRMSAGLIHEINNPLNYARQGLLLLDSHAVEMEGPHGEECRETIGDVLEGVDRVVRIISDLMSFTRPGSRLDEVVNLKIMLQTTLRFFSNSWPPQLSLTCNVDNQAVILGSSGMLVQVFVNLIQNAIDAMGEKTFQEGHGPELTILGRVQGDFVVLKVRDNGPGISEDRAQSIFDPFFTSKDVGKGLGLGLAICHQIVLDHRGTIRMQSEQGEYCEFELAFPVAGDALSI